MDKVFKVADIRDLEQKVALGEMSYSRMVEILNEKAEQHYSKVKKLNEPAVSGNEVKVCPICGKPFYYLYNKDYYQQECECDLSGQT